MGEQRVTVIGAGHAGVSSAVALKDRGIRVLLIDRADIVGAAWDGRYDRLKLNTWKRFSYLPRRPYPAGTPTFPTRDQVVAHLDRHAHEDGIELRLGTTVLRIDRHDHGWRICTDGDRVDTRQLIVATGFEHTPLVPDWPGKAGFTGELVHSASYRNPGPFAGRRVLVVGSGSSGLEIAHDIATGGAAKVWLSVRTPPNIFLRQGPGPMPSDIVATALYHAPPRLADTLARAGRRLTIGDLTEFGLPAPDEGAFTRGHRFNVAPAIVDKNVITAIRDGSIDVVAGVASLDGKRVVLLDGADVEPDAVVCATGYRPGLEPLVGHLGVLNDAGAPRVAGETAAATGLRFIGFQSRPGLLGFVAKQATRMAARIASEL